MIRLVFCLICFMGLFCFGMDPTLNPGALRFKFTYLVESADTFFDKEGAERPILDPNNLGDYDHTSYGVTLEYGWFRDATVVFKSLFQDMEIATGSDNYSVDGFTTAYVGLRQRLSPATSSFVLLSELGAWIPGDYNENEPPALGSGGIDWMATVSYQQIFFPVNGGFEMDFGYLFRNGAPEDEILLDTALYFNVGGSFSIRGEYHVIESRKDNLTNYDALIYPRERGSQVIGVRFDVKLTHRWNILFGYHETLEGRNQIRSDGWRISFDWRR